MSAAISVSRRVCACGSSGAYHADDVHVEIRGPHAQKIFFDNRDLAVAGFSRDQPGCVYASFDHRTTLGYRGGSWPRTEASGARPGS